MQRGQRVELPAVMHGVIVNLAEQHDRLASGTIEKRGRFYSAAVGRIQPLRDIRLAAPLSGQGRAQSEQQTGCD